MSEIKLTDKEDMFCHEYIVDLNGTQAAIRAGYSVNSARQIASQLLSKLNIQDRIAELKQERSERIKIDADYVLKQAVKLHERCMQEVKPKIVGGEQLQDEEGNLVFIFDSSGAAKSLELIGKHVNVNAFKEVVDNNVNMRGSVSIEDWIRDNSK